MRGKAKLIGTLVAVALVLLASAVPARGASFTLEEASYPGLLSGAQGGIGEGEHRFVFNNERSVFCEEVSLSGSLEAESEAILLEPSYSACKTEIGPSILTPATVETNGCAYRFKLGGAEPANGTMDLLCPETYMEFYVYENVEKHEKGQPLCIFGITTQEELGPVTFENQGKGSAEVVRAGAAIESLVFERKGSTFVCGPEAQLGEFHGDTSVSATSEGSAAGFMFG